MKLSGVPQDKPYQAKNKLPMGSLYKDLLAYGKGLPPAATHHHQHPSAGYDFIFGNTLRAHGKFNSKIYLFIKLYLPVLI